MTRLLRALCQTISRVCAGRGHRAGVLVVQPLPGIGDMVWHLPHLHTLASTAPGGSVSVLAKPRSLADRLLSADPSVRQVLWLERNPGCHDGFFGFVRLSRMLRQPRFAEVWLLHGSTRLALATMFAGIPKRIGYGLGAQRFLLSHPVTLPVPDQRRHPIAKANRLLELHGLPLSEASPRLPVSERAAVRMQQRYVPTGTPWVALGIASSEPLKQWGSERFAALCRALTQRRPCRLFLLGGPAEQTMADSLNARLQGTDADVKPVIDMPIDEVAALLARCRLYIGNDTGVLNLAAAVGTPAIGLFGASRPLAHAELIHCVLPRGLDPKNRQGSGLFVDAELEQGMERISVAQVMAEVERTGVL